MTSIPNPSRKPRIGISGTRSVDDALPGYKQFQLVPEAFVAAVTDAGGLPVILPVVAADEVGELLEIVDAVIVTGGFDIDPGTYGAAPGPHTSGTDTGRDAFDVALVHQAMARRLPLLGVCRGIQLVNVALGGTLQQHVEGHMVEDRWSKPAHDVRIEPGSALHLILGVDVVRPNSLHHQAIAELGVGVRAVAHADDGIVEAIEVDGHPEITAVQWHPEWLRRYPIHRLLFEHLVSSAAVYAAGEGPLRLVDTAERG